MFMANVGKYTMHGWYGLLSFFWENQNVSFRKSISAESICSKVRQIISISLFLFGPSPFRTIEKIDTPEASAKEEIHKKLSNL